jgi:hypothetical protein
MWDLAKAGDIPTVFVMQSMAHITFDHTARVRATDRIEAVRTAMFFNYRELQPGLAAAFPSPG